MRNLLKAKVSLLSSKGFHRTRFPLVKFSKHGQTSLTFPGHDPPFDITIYKDISQNPGPAGRNFGLQRNGRALHTNSRNVQNLIKVHFSTQLNGWHQQQLLLCSMNARSIRNKTSDIFELICDSKPDIVAITETWLTTMDSAVKVEVCPEGYKIVDHPRTGRRGGGTALIYSDSFSVKKADAGQKDSFEFSEWLVTSSSHNVRVVIVYRPPYSVDHRVPCSVFIAEFSEYMESIALQRTAGYWRL